MSKSRNSDSFLHLQFYFLPMMKTKTNRKSAMKYSTGLSNILGVVQKNECKNGGVKVSSTVMGSLQNQIQHFKNYGSVKKTISLCRTSFRR